VRFAKESHIKAYAPNTCLATPCSAYPRKGAAAGGGILILGLEVGCLLGGVLARPAYAHIDSEHGSVNINAVIRKAWFGQVEV